MVRKHKVIALISGGKDSFYSLVHVTSLGHEIVALANVYPSTPSEDVQVNEIPAGSCTHVSFPDTTPSLNDDPNSFMYQTAGHALIPLYASALDLPLYRYPIVGSALSKDKSYSEQPEDETESLTHILQHILKRHPEASAVSSGAIFSHYQRTRVESVASRLKLVSLAYLWQWPNLHEGRSLLSSMHDVGMDARIVKVASGGLDSSHLWTNVSDGRSEAKLEKAFSRFGGVDKGVVIGEGGEYETIALHGPRSLWKKKIVIGHDQRKVIEAQGGVSYLRFLGGSVVDTPTSVKDGQSLAKTDELPDGLDELFQSLWYSKTEVSAAQTRRASENFEVCIHDADVKRMSLLECHTGESIRMDSYGSVKITSNTLYLCTQPSSTQAALRNVPTPVDTGVSTFDNNCTILKTQTLDSFCALHDVLNSSGLCLENVVHVNVYLRDMEAFAVLNALYATVFARPCPPSRITIALGDGLPPGNSITMSFIISKSQVIEKDSLHVQSFSYWAPANIGPYSQAVSVPLLENRPGNESRIVYMAGQIPLIPSQMDIYSGTFRECAILALQHLWRVGISVCVDWWITGIAYFTETGYGDPSTRAQELFCLWDALHSMTLNSEASDDEMDDSYDIGDAHLMRPWLSTHNQSRITSTKRITASLPRWDSVKGAHHPPCFAVQVTELPRNAQVEWTSIGLRLQADTSIRYTGWCCTLDETKQSNSGLTFCTHGAATIDDASSLLSMLEDTSDASPMIELYVSQRAGATLNAQAAKLCVIYIPCVSLWSQTNHEILLLARQIGS